MLHSWSEIICCSGRFMCFVSSRYWLASWSILSFKRLYLSSCWVPYWSAWCPSTHWYTVSIVALVLILYAWVSRGASFNLKDRIKERNVRNIRQSNESSKERSERNIRNIGALNKELLCKDVGRWRSS
jgi:hypothetical protein